MGMLELQNRADKAFKGHKKAKLFDKSLAKTKYKG